MHKYVKRAPAWGSSWGYSGFSRKKISMVCQVRMSPECLYCGLSMKINTHWNAAWHVTIVDAFVLSLFFVCVSVSVSVGNTAQCSQVGARRVRLGVRMKCLLSPVLGGWAQLLWSWVNPWFWWLSEVVYSSLLQSLVDMNVYRRPSCR